MGCPECGYGGPMRFGKHSNAGSITDPPGSGEKVKRVCPECGEEFDPN